MLIDWNRRILDKVTPRTRLALIDHVVSQTGLVFPIERIVRELNDRGVDMPPKGGNPGLSDDDLRQVVAYLRSLS